MIGVRGSSGYLAYLSSIVLMVGAAVWLNASDDAKVIIGLSFAGPTLVVALLGPGFRIVPLLGAGSAVYAVWFCLIERDQADIAAESVLGAFHLWPVVAAWAVAGVVAVVVAASAIRIARRRSARRAERRRRGEWTRRS